MKHALAALVLCTCIVLMHAEYRDILAQSAAPVPAPGAAWLCSMGLTILRWLRIRGRL